MNAGETHQTTEAAFRIERARLIAGLVRLVRNVDLAEARVESQAAATLTRNLAERTFLLARADACPGRNI